MDVISRTGYIYEATQMFKTIRGDAPEYLRSFFTFASDIHAVTFIV